MTLDNMTGITKVSYTGDMFCKSQLITCNRVKECNGVCPFEDALQHADKTQAMDEQHTVDHDRDWITGCIQHDGFIHTDRGDKANRIILDALSAEVGQCGEWERVSADKYVQHAYHFYRCSKCGYDHIGKTNFCPNCGARMNGGEEE